MFKNFNDTWNLLESYFTYLEANRKRRRRKYQKFHIDKVMNEPLNLFSFYLLNIAHLSIRGHVRIIFNLSVINYIT